MEKGREKCRTYVEERKFVRAAKEAGMSKGEVLEGAARGELIGVGGENGSTEERAIESAGKGSDAALRQSQTL